MNKLTNLQMLLIDLQKSCKSRTSTCFQEIGPISRFRCSFSHWNWIAFTFLCLIIVPTRASERHETVFSLNAFCKVFVTSSMRTWAKEVVRKVTAWLSCFSTIWEEIGMAEIFIVANHACASMNNINKLSITWIQVLIDFLRVLKCRISWIYI